MRTRQGPVLIFQTDRKSGRIETEFRLWSSKFDLPGVRGTPGAAKRGIVCGLPANKAGKYPRCQPDSSKNRDFPLQAQCQFCADCRKCRLSPELPGNMRLCEFSVERISRLPRVAVGVTFSLLANHLHSVSKSLHIGFPHPLT